MVDPEERLPDHTWFDGQVASWEGQRFGYLNLFEVIVDPTSFREVVNSAGDDEIVELFEPQPGQNLKLTFLDTEDQPLPQEPTVLDADNPTTIIPQSTRFEMDATGTTATGYLAYTCIAYGLKSLEADGQQTPEALANRRFITLFHEILDARGTGLKSKICSGNIRCALLPRIPGWEPDKTKFEDVANVLNRIFVDEASGYSDSLDHQEVHISDTDPEDSSRYFAKRFKIVGDQVSLDIDHMRVTPDPDEPARISTKAFEQAPSEILNAAADEIESILAR